MTAEEELQAGIKNALERGIPLEKAIQTFINAGYQPSIVQSAARLATEGATTIAPQVPKPEKSLPNSDLTGSSQPAVKNAFSFPSGPMSVPIPAGGQQTYTPKPVVDESVTNEGGTSNLKVIVLVVILLLLLGTLAASLLFREQILAMFG